MKCFITGAAGFIGSHLVDRLLAKGHEVIGYDNLSTGKMVFLSEAIKSQSFKLIEGDLLNETLLQASMTDVDIVFHLAANADVRFGTCYPDKDLWQNTIATCNVLQAMQKNKVKRIVFSSTGSIYGEAKVIPTPEAAVTSYQTSLYGASKISAESFIEAYCEGYDMQALIFRFVSILGERYTHGHLFDFYQQLMQDHTSLTVLGNGKQRKSYLYVHDCIDAILLAVENQHEKVNIYNLGTDEYCEVNDSIRWMCEYLNVNPKIRFTGGDRGWVGDNPFIWLDCKKIQEQGWRASHSIKESVFCTLSFFQNNPTLFKAKDAVAS